MTIHHDHIPIIHIIILMTSIHSVPKDPSISKKGPMNPPISLPLLGATGAPLALPDAHPVGCLPCPARRVLVRGLG